jgi:hypothetical protein
MDTPPAARYSPGAVSWALRLLNIVATLLTLASGVGVLAQDLLVDGYREHHRDWVAFVAAYCGAQAYTLEQLFRNGRALPWLIAARAAVAYFFLLNLTSLWPQWRYWTPGRYVYELVDLPGILNAGLLTLIFLGRGAGNTWSLIGSTQDWWRPLRKSHPFAGRLVTAAFAAGVVFPVWTYLLVLTQEANVYSPEAEAVAREVLAGIPCAAVQEKAGQQTTDLRRRGETSYHVQIAYDCELVRVVVRMEDGRVGSYYASPGDCCARAAAPAQKG